MPACKMITPTCVSGVLQVAREDADLVRQWGVKPSSWEWGQQPGDGFSYNTLGPQWILS